jgi:hypothetical protein
MSSDTNELDLVYTGISINQDGHAALTTVAGELAERDIDHTLLYFWSDEEWDVVKTPKAIISVLWPDGASEIHCLAADGFVLTITEDDELTAQIDTGDEGPSDLVIMKEIRSIGDRILAVGMARHAYRCKNPQGKWEAIDADCFVPRAKRNSVIGFFSIDGFSAKDCYAVGHEGEIWHFDGKTWRQNVSPTNVLLTKVACDATTGTVWAVGLVGTILRGQSGQWAEFRNSLTKGDFWGLAIFAGTVFVASEQGVFKVVGDDLEAVKLSAKTPVTTSYLAASSKEIWSVGDKDIFRSADGVRWKRLKGP